MNFMFKVCNTKYGITVFLLVYVVSDDFKL